MESDQSMSPGLGKESPATPPAASASSYSSGDGSGTVDHAKDKVRDVAGAAQRKVADELRTRADSTRSHAADAIGSVADALTSSAQQLRNDEEGASVDFVRRAGDQLQRVSDYLRNNDTDELIRNAENFARRQPAVFLAGAFALGFLGARLVKSTQSPGSGGSIPHDRSLVPRSSMWTGDREAAVTGFREPIRGSAVDNDTNPGYTRQLGTEAL